MSSMRCGISRDSARSGILARSIRWRRAFSCCCSAELRGWCSFTTGAGNAIRRVFDLVLRPTLTIRTGKHKGRTLRRHSMQRFSKHLPQSRVGRFEQMPPAFSAKKVKGVPAYELARKKQPVELKAVEVELFEYKLTDIEGTVARFVIECSSGTYIRSLAHDMGQKLGCGAHLAEITRTAVGEFSLEQAIKLEELAEASRAGKFADCLIPLENLLPNFPRVNVLPIIEKRVRHGTKFNVQVSQIQPGRVELPPGATLQLEAGELKPPRLRVFSQQDKLVAIAEALVPRTYQPIVVFDPLP